VARRPAPVVRRWQATLIVVLVFVAVAGAALAGWWYARESPPHQGPLFLISIDGLSADHLPAYGGTRSDSPAIDALAADAIVFDRAYAHSPQALPSYASLLTGKLPFEHGVRDDAGFTLADDQRTLAELLRNRGFTTGAAVSSFLLRRQTGLAQGFGFYDADLPEPEDAQTQPLERDGTLTADAAERWLRTQGGQRFFLFIEVDAAAADAVVAGLVQTLKQRSLYDNATILLTADHGDSGSLVSLDEATLRVPLIVKQPDSDGAGRRIAAPVQVVDILPTVLDLVRAPIPSGLRGRSLRPVLDSEDAVLVDQPIYAESLVARFRVGGRPVYGLTRGQYRYVTGDNETLYDLSMPGAPALASPNAEAARLQTELKRLLEGTTIQAPADIAAADEDRYAALGYLPGARLAHVMPPTIDPFGNEMLIQAHHAAAVLAGERQYAAAIDRMRDIARAHADLPVVQYQLGTLLARTGGVDEAVAAFRAAARLNPDASDARVALAAMLTRAQQLEPAREQAALAIALAERENPRSLAVAHEMAARIALERQDPDEALMHAEAAHAADQTRPIPQFVAGRIAFAQERYDDALEAFEQAAAALAESGGTLKDLQQSIGDTLVKLDRPAEAEMHFAEEARDFPAAVDLTPPSPRRARR
jgi:tetratricopeptide (TPR) repeat protein